MEIFSAILKEISPEGQKQEQFFSQTRRQNLVPA